MWRKAETWLGQRPYLVGAILSLLAAIFATLTSFALEPVYLAMGSEGVQAAIYDNLPGLIFGMAGFGLVAWTGLRMVGRQQTAIADSHCEIEPDPPQKLLPRSALIMGFSQFGRSMRSLPESASEEERAAARRKAKLLPGEEGFEWQDANGRPTHAIEVAVADGAGNRIFGNWQQTLRLIERLNRAPRRMEHVRILIGDQGIDDGFSGIEGTPNGPDNAMLQCERLLQILRAYFPQTGFDFVRAPNGPADARFRVDGGSAKNSYSNVDFVRDGFRQAHMALAREMKLSMREAEKRIFIDVTAGTAIFSIAAATYSFNRDLMIVYVGSGRDSNRTYGFDLSLMLGSYQA